MKKFLCLYLFVGVLVAAPLADVWDVQGDNDNTLDSDNELIHGSSQQHDLGALVGPTADQDWYRIGQNRQSSYEVTIDETSGDIGFNSLTVQRIAADGTTVLQNAGFVTDLYSFSLRFANITATDDLSQRIKVANALCGTSCGADDVYRIRMTETTVSVARYNNSGSQVTVLLVQNPTNASIASSVFYWSTAGSLVGTSTITTAAKALSVIATAGVTGATSGSITIAHDGPYGGLNVKSVALEPATGFSFDTPGVYRGF